MLQQVLQEEQAGDPAVPEDRETVYADLQHDVDKLVDVTFSFRHNQFVGHDFVDADICERAPS